MGDNLVKYPIVYTYRHTHDKGMELRYSLRSVKNLTNWNGEVFILGDTEKWLRNVTHIPNRRYSNGYVDQEYLMLAALADERIDEDFIYMMDDIYITEKINLSYMYCHESQTKFKKGYHYKQKEATTKWLNSNGHSSLDYDLHVPMIHNKERRLKIYSILKSSMNGLMLKPRTLYGNIYQVGGQYYEDKKTKTNELPEGSIISTQFYTHELNELFPEPSKFEKF